MKCQKCDKPATFHITEIEGGKHEELHFCEDCARVYLAPVAENTTEATGEAVVPTEGLGQTAEELSKLDQKSCPVCGITFLEFRNAGRLGCPHDYVAFEKELEPLILNIHNDTKHVGKVSPRHAGGTEELTALIQLRREMKDAVAREDYEQAGALRDRIRRIEEAAQPNQP